MVSYLSCTSGRCCLRWKGRYPTADSVSCWLVVLGPICQQKYLVLVCIDNFCSVSCFVCAFVGTVVHLPADTWLRYQDCVVHGARVVLSRWEIEFLANVLPVYRLLTMLRVTYGTEACRIEKKATFAKKSNRTPVLYTNSASVCRYAKPVRHGMED